jgi:hypothetical protein
MLCCLISSVSLAFFCLAQRLIIVTAKIVLLSSVAPDPHCRAGRVGQGGARCSAERARACYCRTGHGRAGQVHLGRAFFTDTAPPPSPFFPLLVFGGKRRRLALHHRFSDAISNPCLTLTQPDPLFGIMIEFTDSVSVTFDAQKQRDLFSCGCQASWQGSLLFK